MNKNEAIARLKRRNELAKNQHLSLEEKNELDALRRTSVSNFSSNYVTNFLPKPIGSGKVDCCVES